MTIPFELPTVVIAALVVGSAYIIFGILLADRLLMFAILLPFALVGVWFGHRIHGRISCEQVTRFISGLMLLIGVSVLWRAVAG